MVYSRRRAVSLLLAGASAAPFFVMPSWAADTSHKDLDRDATKALNQLYAKSPKAKDLGKTAKAILVFPRITKAGFLVGGAYGEGALRQGNKSAAYYVSTAASYGLQVGVQWFGYVLFLMNDKALKYLDESDGWEIGVGPSVVVEDVGSAAKKMSSTTESQDVHAFIFGQHGLFGGMGLEGTKITKMGAKS
jgi:lipid-binding SYLF domain-containing protein